jgi:hypothetical protein
LWSEEKKRKSDLSTGLAFAWDGGEVFVSSDRRQSW